MSYSRQNKKGEIYIRIEDIIKRPKATRTILGDPYYQESEQVPPDVLIFECPDPDFIMRYKLAMILMGFVKASKIASVGGGWIFASKDTHRYKGVVKEGKARLNIFKNHIKEIILSVHCSCKYLKEKGYSFKSVEEEIETLIQIIEVAFPVAEEHFGASGIPIRGIVFPAFDENRVAPPPIVLNFQ